MNDLNTIMLSVITGLLTLMGTSFGWWLARLSKKIDDLMQHRQGSRFPQLTDKALEICWMR